VPDAPFGSLDGAASVAEGDQSHFKQSDRFVVACPGKGQIKRVQGRL